MKDPLAAFRRLAEKPAAVFILVSLWLGLEHIGLGPYSYLQIHDAGDSRIPGDIAAANTLLKHGVQYWMPSIAGGVDRLADGISYLHPSTLLFAVFPVWLAYQIMLLGHFFLAGYFTYRVAKDHLRLSVEASFFAGAAMPLYFNFTPIWMYQWGFSAFPLVLWYLEENSRKKDSSRFFVGAMLAGILYSAVSSVATSLPFCLSMMAVWFLLISPKLTFRFWMMFLIFCIGSMTLHGQIFLAMMLNAPLSQRAPWEGLVEGTAKMEWVRLAPDILIHNAGPVFLVLVGGFVSGFKDKRFRILVFLLFCVTIGLVGVDYLKKLVSPYLGFFSGFNMIRFNEHSSFLAALAGAVALDLIPRERDFRRWVLAAAVGVMILQSGYQKIGNVIVWFYQGGITANYASPFLRDLAETRAGEIFRVASIVHGLNPAYANVYGLESVDAYVNLYPRRYQRLWLKVLEPMEAFEELSGFLDDVKQHGNYLYLHLDSIERGPDGLKIRELYNLTLLSLMNTKYIISRHPLKDESLQVVSSAPDWKRLRRKERVRLRLRENIRGKSYFYLYENKDVFPRFFITERAKVFPNAGSLFDGLGEASLEDLRGSVYVEEEFFDESPVFGGVSSREAVAPREYTPDRIVLSLKDASGFLVVTNNHSPFWKCEVDGAPRKIFPAYGVFWGVRIGKKDREAVFYYDPPYRSF